MLSGRSISTHVSPSQGVWGRGTVGYERAVGAAAERLGARLCEPGWRLTHLLANRKRERTFVGVVR